MTGSVHVAPLGEVVKPTRPRVKPSEHPALPFIGMEHIEAQTMKLLGTVPASTMKSSAVHFRPGDVLYGRLRPYLNKVYRPSFEGLCSAEFIVLPENERVDGAYLQYFLNSSAFVRYASHLNAGDRPRVDFDQLAEYPIPVPSKPEQRRIVGEIEKQFSRLDEAIANLKRVKANLKRYKATVLKAAVEGRLVPTEAELARRKGISYETGAQLLRRVFKNRRISIRNRKRIEPALPDTTGLPELPAGWEWASIDKIAAETQIGLDRGREGQNSDRRGSPYVKMNNVNLDGQISWDDLVYVDATEEEQQRFGLCDGDLLFNTRNSKELVGKVGLVLAPPKQTIYNNNLMRLRIAGGILPAFVCAQMCSTTFRARMEKIKRATTNVAAVYAKDLLPLAIAVPPTDEQFRIVSELDRRLSLVREVEAEVDTDLERARALRRTILAAEFGHRLVSECHGL